MHAIYFVAAFMVILGAVLAKYSVIESEKFYARFLILAGLAFFILPSFWGCGGSPTAPSTSYRLTFAKAPGCEPGEIPQQPASLPTVTIQLPGSRTLTAVWPGLTIEFLSFGSNYLICKVTKTEAAS